MAKIEEIGNMQIADNKENKFFCFPMISMACTGSGYEKEVEYSTSFFIPYIKKSPYFVSIDTYLLTFVE